MNAPEELEEGSALVEMALVLPILLLILTGIFTFSVALNQKLTMTEALNVAGRAIATDAGDTNPCQTASNALYAAAPLLKPSSFTVKYTLTPVGGSAVPYNSASCPGSATDSTVVNTNLASGGNVEIDASYPCSLSIYGVKYSGCTITESIQEVVQ
ncbi:MAG: TadE/TadG family type IV pilus assembly protein [Terracidiphilus sp.]